MLLNHAVALAECRSYLAALADTAPSGEASLEYQDVLLQLDGLNSGHLPPVTPVPTENRKVLYTVALKSLGRLEEHGMDPFDLALCQCMLATAWGREHQQ
jgi:hypothetical protein